VSRIDRELVDAALRRCVLFRRVTPADLDRCTAELAHRHYRRGETIFHSGDPGDALHVVVSGSVKIELPSPQGDEPAILARIDAGGYFGELALLDGEPRSATVVALEPTETLVLDRVRFERLLADLPTLRSCLLASLSGELRRLTGQLEAMLFLDLAGRLATRIVALAEADPAVEGAREDVRVPWPYTQAEVASMIGGSRESVNRLLGDLTGRGLLRIERDHLVIPDLDLLAAEAVA
jgi:CRP/FNR family transcriptional regulator, cyclic AMP receptor protein